MNHIKFGLYRRLLFLTVLEAAKNIARTSVRPDGVSERAWNRWEAGESEIPLEVWENLSNLIQERQRKIEYFVELYRLNDRLNIPLSAGKENIIAYKMEQSVAAQLAAIGVEICNTPK